MDKGNWIKNRDYTPNEEKALLQMHHTYQSKIKDLEDETSPSQYLLRMLNRMTPWPCSA